MAHSIAAFFKNQRLTTQYFCGIITFEHATAQSPKPTPATYPRFFEGASFHAGFIYANSGAFEFALTYRWAKDNF
jgi:hypothetical protein